LSGNIVARRYAKALFAFGEKQGAAELQAYGEELSRLAEVLGGSPETLRFFKSPVFNRDEKKSVLGKVLEAAAVRPAMKNFCDLLADKDRLPFLPDIAGAFGKLLDAVNGVVRGRLVTAVELPEARRIDIKNKLEKQAGKQLELDYAVDKGILGGIVLKVGDRVLDASLRAQLDILKETIKRGE
jgi:F-type H+-transporting ATPase subunit delta